MAEELRKKARAEIIYPRPITIRVPLERKWEPKSVVDFIIRCRDAKGIPQFRTHFVVPFRVDHKPAVVAVCYGASREVPSTLFTNVPEHEYKALQDIEGDWKFILRAYGTEKQKREYLIPYY